MKSHFKERFGSNENFSLLPPLPNSLNIELNNTCNHKCIFCGLHGPYAPPMKLCVMDLDFVKKILIQAKELGIGEKEVGFYLAGEPLLYDKFVDVIRFAKELGFKYTFITTNGVLAKPKIMKEVIDAGLDSIRFSINASDKETYKIIHGKDDFDVVLDNIRFLHDYLNKMKKHINTSISYVVTKKTESGIKKMKELFGSMVDDILFIPVMHLNKLNLDLDHEYSIIKETNENKKLMCPIIFNTMYINSDAKVKLCCTTYQNSLYIADLKKELDLKAAWESPIYKKYRKAFLDNDVSNTLCEDCILRTQGVSRMFIEN